MLKADAKIFVAYEDADSFDAISEFALSPENLPRIPRKEEMATANFSEFWVEQSWGNAVTAVTDIDVIIFSLSGRMDLPVPVRRWMENWPNFEQINHTTLIVVFGNREADDSKHHALTSYFQQIAVNHGLDFLCHSCPQSMEQANQADSRQNMRQ